MFMIRILLALLFATSLFMRAQAQPYDPSAFPVYEGADLGMTYSTKLSTFRIWAPTAEAAELLLYDRPLGGTVMRSIALETDPTGWSKERSPSCGSGSPSPVDAVIY